MTRTKTTTTEYHVEAPIGDTTPQEWRRIGSHGTLKQAAYSVHRSRNDPAVAINGCRVVDDAGNGYDLAAAWGDEFAGDPSVYRWPDPEPTR